MKQAEPTLASSGSQLQLPLCSSPHPILLLYLSKRLTGVTSVYKEIHSLQSHYNANKCCCNRKSLSGYLATI